MAHEPGAGQGHDEACLRRHLAALLILVIELLENLVEVLHVFVHGLGPAVELNIERVEAAVEILDACDHAHERLALEAERGLQVARIHEPEILLFHFVEAVIHRVALRHGNTLLLEALELVEVVDLLLLFVLWVRARRCGEGDAGARGRLGVREEGAVLLGLLELDLDRGVCRAASEIQGHRLQRIDFCKADIAEAGGGLREGYIDWLRRLARWHRVGGYLGARASWVGQHTESERIVRIGEIDYIT